MRAKRGITEDYYRIQVKEAVDHGRPEAAILAKGVEAATIIHHGYIDIDRAFGVASDIAPNRDPTMAALAPPLEQEPTEESACEETTQYYSEDLLGLEIPLVELFAPAWLLGYCGLLDSGPVCSPATEPSYLVAR